MLFRWSFVLMLASPHPAQSVQTLLCEFERRCDRQHCLPLVETVEISLAPVLGDVGQVALRVGENKRTLAQVHPETEILVWASEGARHALIRSDKAQALWTQVNEAGAAQVRFGICREAI